MIPFHLPTVPCLLPRETAEGGEGRRQQPLEIPCRWSGKVPELLPCPGPGPLHNLFAQVIWCKYLNFKGKKTGAQMLVT